MPLSDELLNAIDKYLNGNANDQDKLLLREWYHSFNDELVEVTGDEKDLLEKIDARLRLRLSEHIGTPIKELPAKKNTKIFILRRISAAAAILIFISAGFYFLLQKKQSIPQLAKRYDIAPGGNKATLSLANGQKIVLNNRANGLIANQSNIQIRKQGNGEVKYQQMVSSKGNVILYDTLTTPNGGMTSIALSDGTVVWLNAASSIRFPENFPGNERKIELLSGEAYFEVAHDKTKPFRVLTHGQTVEVLGTHFDVNTYKDDGLMRTTLLQGSIRLTIGQVSGLLKPGEQAVTHSGNAEIRIVNADTEDVMAWRNGKFRFDNTSLTTVLHQLERWYDVSAQIQGGIPDVRFSGGTYMNKNLSEVLNVLELNGIHCRIEGRKIIVHP